MGGHGGLNILPQKKWNVYNWDNREVVERDKRIHEQKKRKEYEQQREQKLGNKINVLKQENNILPEYDQKQEKSKHSLISLEMKRLAEEDKHVNLFEEEEKILMNREAEEVKRLKEEEFLKDKNMDYSSRFLGSYNDSKNLPWYSKKKGDLPQKHRNKHFKKIDKVIYGTKTESNITRQVVEASKRQAFQVKEEEERDRTREKVYKRYDELEDKFTRMDPRKSQPLKDLVKHEEDLLMNEFKNNQESQLERLRRKRLRREQKQRKRVQQLKKKMKQ